MQFLQLYIIAATWLPLLVGLVAAAPVDLRTVFSGANWFVNTTIAYPGSAYFEDSTERWTIFDPPTYSAVVRPGTEADVVQVIQLAGSHKIPFLATGGRHGFGTTLGRLDEGLAIDLSGFDSVQVDADVATATVGGGATFADIYEPIFAAGYEIQTGSCSCPGVLGVTLGGGIGRYQSLHGLIIDALVSVRLVTASGEIVTASQTSNPELFWGIRGAGTNFGIVTSATYKLSPLTNSGLSLTADFVFPVGMTEAFFHVLAVFSGETIPGLSAITLFVYDEETSSPQILTNWVYAGPEDEGRRILEPLFALNPPFANATMVPWNRLVYEAGFGLDAAFCTGPAVRSIYTASMRKLSADTYQAAFEKLSAFWEDVPQARRSTIELELLGEPVAGAIPDADTAYPWRDAVAYTMFQMTWTDATVAGQANALARELRDDFAATSGYDGLATYVSYAHGDEPITAIYGERKLTRLAALKNRWDPDNVFGFYNALPRQYA
ncbi:hypothetical protein F5X99DRAFT_413572 [Biscogniauxia marginata]|nr:hypothetical protein F5X99DRAFT_413572 [Biscogniauxia marginata]